MHCQHLTRDVLLSKRCIVKTTKNKPKPRDVLLQEMLKKKDVLLQVKNKRLKKKMLKKMYCYKRLLFLKKDMLKKM